MMRRHSSTSLDTKNSPTYVMETRSETEKTNNQIVFRKGNFENYDRHNGRIQNWKSKDTKRLPYSGWVKFVRGKEILKELFQLMINERVGEPIAKGWTTNHFENSQRSERIVAFQL